MLVLLSCGLGHPRGQLEFAPGIISVQHCLLFSACLSYTQLTKFYTICCFIASRSHIASFTCRCALQVPPWLPCPASSFLSGRILSLTCPPTEGQIGYFQLLAITNKAAANTHCRFCVDVFSTPVGKYKRASLLDCKVKSTFSFVKKQQTVHQSVCIVPHPAGCGWGLLWPTPSPACRVWCGGLGLFSWGSGVSLLL